MSEINWDAWFDRRTEILNDVAVTDRDDTEDALDALYGEGYAPVVAERDALRAEVERLRTVRATPEPVGVFCTHEDETSGQYTHEGWGWTDEGREWVVQPDTYMSHGPVPAEGEPRCPRAVPVYAVDVPALMRELDEARAEAKRLRSELANMSVFAQDGNAIAEQASALHRDARAEIGRLRSQLGMHLTAWRNARRRARRWRDERDRLFDEGDRLRATAHGLGRDYREARAERDRLAEQVKRVRARHQGVCGGACGLPDGCECGEQDLMCDECETPHPCRTRRDLAEAAQKVLRMRHEEWLDAPRSLLTLAAVAVPSMLNDLADRMKQDETDRAFVESVVAAWVCGGAHPADARDALTAIRDRLYARTPAPEPGA